MAPSLAKFLLTALLSSVIVTASPAYKPRSQYADHAIKRRANLNIKRTTQTETTTIDWVDINSQGVDSIAAAPPHPPAGLKQAKFKATSNDFANWNASKPVAELQEPGAELGPPGTVPIPQVSPEYLENVAEKSLPDIRNVDKRQNAGKHWYVSSNQGVANTGGSAIYSVYKAYVNNGGDFSLLQTAITHDSSKGGQTLEAGWINYPNQVAQPHLFTFYTTNGYSNQANNQGGWNQDVTGWVQVDTQIFPGTVFSPNSVDGGAQYEIQIQYLLYQGNWWLWVLDRWIGYYPASLFSAGTTGTNLAGGADGVFYYGELYQNEGPMTNTDMGSGRFGTTGWTHSAYIRQMVYSDPSGNYHAYTAGFWDSDSSLWNHQNAQNDANWGSYVFLGGPGAGGVTGG